MKGTDFFVFIVFVRDTVLKKASRHCKTDRSIYRIPTEFILAESIEYICLLAISYQQFLRGA